MPGLEELLIVKTQQAASQPSHSPIWELLSGKLKPSAPYFSSGCCCSGSRFPLLLSLRCGSSTSRASSWAIISTLKMKTSKAVKPRPATGESQKRDTVTAPNEDYIVGQVANSLFQNKPKVCDTNPLVQLFSTPGVETQPVYVAVPRASKKRKHVEEEIAAEVQDSSTKGEALKKMKKPKKQNLSLAELRVANREFALDKADEEEEKKEKQIKEKLKNRHSQLATKNLSGEQSGVKQKKAQVNPAEEMLKNKRTLFVGNLPVNCTAQMLKSFFREFGPIESVRFRSLIPAEDGLSKKMAAIKRKVHPDMKYINAYVVFKEERAANSALKRNGTEFSSGFHIRVDLASQSTSHDNKKSIFVGNLPYEVDDDTVRNHFSECGNVMGVRIIRDRNTGIGKGFGYVLFESADAVHLALKLNNSELKGRKVRVHRCVKKEKSQLKNLVKNVKRPVGLKYANNSSPRNTKGNSNNSFAGEKADPMKKGKKARVKMITNKKLRKSK